MENDEKDITTYLKGRPGEFVSAREIARKAGGKRRFEDEPHWAVPILRRLMDKSIIESDSMSHYRLVPKTGKTKSKRWISPQIQKLLDKTGKDFNEGVVIDEPAKPDA